MIWSSDTNLMYDLNIYLGDLFFCNIFMVEVAR
jgi:hypothetical protein